MLTPVGCLEGDEILNSEELKVAGAWSLSFRGIKIWRCYY